MAEEPDETPEDESAPIREQEEEGAEEYVPDEDGETDSVTEQVWTDGEEQSEDQEELSSEIEEEAVEEDPDIVHLSPPVSRAKDDGEDTGDKLLQPCTNCATLLDVADLEPFAKVHCPICGTAIRARTQLKNFTLVETLGAGGMGAVYKALDTNLNRMVALKVVRKEFSADAEYLGKFEREARITASVTHPHVVKVYSFGSDHGLFYIAMELVDKGSLDDLMNLQGRVAEIQALGVGIQVAQGLQAAHQKGLIHRDVKPGNILFADSQTAKIVDFGLALLAAHEAEERGEVWGTPYYVAPEKLDHQPEDFRSDMYSLGGTLFHAIAGRPPFEADTASMVALKHLKSKAVSLQAFAPDVSSATAYVINRTLHKDPDQRYQSYAELVEHLEYARAQLTDSATGGPRKPKQRLVVEGSGQQKLAAIVTLVMMLLIFAVGAGVWVFRDRIFGKPGDVTVTADDPDAPVKRVHQRFDAARKQILAGDYAGALDSLQKLSVDSDLTQPLQNWVTVNQGLATILQENVKDTRDWFSVVKDRSRFSNDPADASLVNFFSKLGGAMGSGSPISPGSATAYSLQSEEALAPLLFGLKDWALGKFQDAAQLLTLYLGSTPQDPFQWVADFKPIARKLVDEETAYQAALAAAASANTPDARAAALQQVRALEPQAKGKFAITLARVEQSIKEKSALLDASYNRQIALEIQQDQAALLDARTKYATLCAGFKFADAYNAVSAAEVTSPDAVGKKRCSSRRPAGFANSRTSLSRISIPPAIRIPLSIERAASSPTGRNKQRMTRLPSRPSLGPSPLPGPSFPRMKSSPSPTFSSRKSLPRLPPRQPTGSGSQGCSPVRKGCPVTAVPCSSRPPSRRMSTRTI